MKIAVVGLGYVGAVSAACLAANGHRVSGVDINQKKVDMLNSGKAPIIEPNLKSTIQRALQMGTLRSTTDVREALCEVDLCFISVATPTRRNGEIDSSFLLNACQQVASAIASARTRPAVIIRSSVLPDIFQRCCQLIEELVPGLAVGVNPEFLREGSAISDFYHPPLIVVGANEPETVEKLKQAYRDIPAPICVLPPREALLVKYASNAFHALKISFTNEISAFCAACGADADRVMATFCADTVLNISSRYLKPGFAFGGSCLPKDVRALLSSARHHDIELPLIGKILESNNNVIRRAATMILDLNVKRIGMVGLSFKSDTDDLRESPFVSLVETLLGKGLKLRIYDPNVSTAKLTGANKDFIESAIPHLSCLLVSSLEELLAEADLLIIGHKIVTLDQLRAIAAHDCLILDLVESKMYNISPSKKEGPCYEPMAQRAAS
jgi:GDP-mannose 6-dehydrogenase